MPYNCIRRHSSSSHIEEARREDPRGTARRFASWQARQRRSVLHGPNQNECDFDRLVAFVSPGMTRAVLNDDVVRFQMNFLSVVS
jgi:hypothetical protein